LLQKVLSREKVEALLGSRSAEPLLPFDKVVVWSRYLATGTG
jgi:hypothetical protein